MKKIKVCFIGIGSIARRHIRNLVSIAEEDFFEVQIDVVRRSADLFNLDEREFVHNVYTDVKALPPDYDTVFITNPTDMHIDTLEEVESNAQSFFIEKPLTSVQKLNEVQRLKLSEDKVYYVACPLRYHPVIQYLKREVQSLRVINVRSICSSYLPEWRSGVDYRDTYSAHGEMGGGVSVDLIHEWDYLQYIFGMPQKVIYCAGKKSDLEIDCEDTAIYIAEYADKFVELHLDYFGRKSVRQMLLFTDEDTVQADLLSGEISYLKSGKKVNFDVERDDYQKAEMRHFLTLFHKKNSDNSIMEAYRTMQLTQGVVEELKWKY